jgi:uncharacterized protein (DUF1330 family)
MQQVGNVSKDQFNHTLRKVMIEKNNEQHIVEVKDEVEYQNILNSFRNICDDDSEIITPAPQSINILIDFEDMTFELWN